MVDREKKSPQLFTCCIGGVKPSLIAERQVIRLKSLKALSDLRADSRVHIHDQSSSHAV